MSGNGRRGRRGGRRQRRREELGREQSAPNAAPDAAPAQQTNGQSGPGYPSIEAAAAREPAHPRPLSARELVARLEAVRARDEAAVAQSSADALVVLEPTEAPADAKSTESPPIREPRRFAARGTEWIARIAGRGTGGTGRVAPARVGAIQFAEAAQPDSVSAEVISPHAHLDDLYDEELAELLERGLRLKGNA